MNRECTTVLQPGQRETLRNLVTHEKKKGVCHLQHSHRAYKIQKKRGVLSVLKCTTEGTTRKWVEKLSLSVLSLHTTATGNSMQTF